MNRNVTGRSSVPVTKYRTRLALQPLEDRITPAFYLVTSTSDATGQTSTAGTGSVDSPYQITSLRSAIEQANLDVGSDTIQFDASLSGSTIQVSNGVMAISSAIVITGLGATQLTIDGQNATRLFTVSSGQALSLSKLTLSNASLLSTSQGAVINNTSGSVSIDQCTFSSNKADYAGVIYNSNGTCTISASTFTSNTATYDAGVLYNSGGNMLITGSTFTSNSSNYGGAVYNSNGNVIIRNSTFDSNRVNTAGAAVYNAGSVTITQSTFYGNLASNQGGGLANFNTAIVVNSTFVGNRANTFNATTNPPTGGGIYSHNDPSVSTTLYNNIVAGNFVNSTGTTANDLGGTKYTAASNNVIGDSASAGGLSSTSNVIGATVSSLFTTGLLAANGGPTQTIAIKGSGAAVNAGLTSRATEDGTTTGVSFTTDQRGTGYKRPLGAVDAGAFEIQLGVSLSASSVNEFRAIGTQVATFVPTFGSTSNYTFSLVSGTGSTDNASFTISGDKLLVNGIFNATVKSSYSIRVRMALNGSSDQVESAFTITVNDLSNIYISSNTLVVVGTTGNDVFGFTSGSVHTFVLNGASYQVNASTTPNLSFVGNGGTDTVYMSSSGNYSVGVSPTNSVLTGSNFTFSAYNVQYVTAYGNASSTAYMYDSAGNDTFAGASTYSVLGGSNFTLYAIGFGKVAAYASTGTDTAYQNDGSGSNSYLATSTYTVMTGSSFQNAASGFDTTTAYRTSGNTIAYVYDAAGNNIFVGTSTYSLMSSGSINNYLVGFQTINVYSTKSTSTTAYLYDSTGSDQFAGSGTLGRMTYANGTVWYISSFANILIDSNLGGNDTVAVGSLSYKLTRSGNWK